MKSIDFDVAFKDLITIALKIIDCSVTNVLELEGEGNEVCFHSSTKWGYQPFGFVA